MARRRRNPKRARLTPADEGSLAARKDTIQDFAHDVVRNLNSGNLSLSYMAMVAWKNGLSWVQIRKGLHKAMNMLVTKVKARAR